MRTELPADFIATDAGRRADEILRACVHCGFCNATCPTYQLVGDELDGPRGRIYLIKEMLEAGAANPVAVRHLDRCLTCRACETTCPSGVAYGELAEIGREFVEREGSGEGSGEGSRDVSRDAVARLQRWWLKAVVPNPRSFRRWARLGSWFRWLLPRRLAAQIPVVGRRGDSLNIADGTLQRRVLVLQGCVQQVSTPGVNRQLRSLLRGRGIEVFSVPEEACCGSLALHLGDRAAAEAVMRRNVDVLSPHLDAVEAVISTASGCGVTVKDYGRLLAADPDYADRARALSDKALDVGEYLAAQGASWERGRDVRRVAWQAPCSLQHGQQLRGQVESLLRGAGYELVPVRDPHLCCGSAGTYSLLQPEIAERLKTDKLASLTAGRPEVIATANVGCQLHLGTAAPVPVVHWLELLR